MHAPCISSSARCVRPARRAAPRTACCGAESASSTREAHNAAQARAFDSRVESFRSQPPAEVAARLRRVAHSAPLPPNARVLDVATGAGPLVPHLLEAGAAHVLGCDLSAEMLRAAEQSYPSPGVLGNARGVRFWHGDVVDLPAWLGPFHAVFFNACFGNVFAQRDTLARTALLTCHGGHMVLSHPLGRAYVHRLHQADPLIVPHELPDEPALRTLISGLPLRLVSLVDEPAFYCALLQIPVLFHLQDGPSRLQAPVVSGFGRGSAQLGFPTANLCSSRLAPALAALPRGVYYGWAVLESEPDAPRKCVLNIGARPTFADGEGDTVEVHVMHRYETAFYGAQLRVLVLGFFRPEMRFSGIQELVSRIKADVGLAASLLDAPSNVSAKEDAFLSGAWTE